MHSERKPESGQTGLSFASIPEDYLASGIVVIDADKKITTFGAGAEQITGVKVSRALHRSFEVLPAPLRKLIRETLRSGESAPEAEVKLRRRGKNEIPARAVAIPIKAGRKGSGVVLVLNDTSPIIQLEHNMRRLDRLASIGTLSASMAHEIKNALVAVKTFIDLVLEKGHDPELTQTVGREMRRIDGIVSQMLRFAGHAQPAFTSVRVHDVLNHSLRMVQHQIDDKLISLSRRFDAASDTVKGDDYQLEQAFVNLILNALEAMGPSGALTVATENVTGDPAKDTRAEARSARLVRVSIHDTGVGVPPENMNRLFEPFFTTKQNGTGLGLPICQRIIQEHHGLISVQSEPNKGTTFLISLPAVAHGR